MDDGTAQRAYRSRVRDDGARATRRRVVEAASELFVARGFSATTIDAVADRAGVSRRTVFTAVGGKAELLKLAWDWALVGDDEPVAMVDRPAVQAIIAERDPRRMVELWVEMQLDVGARAAPVGRVVTAAADGEAEIAALLERIRAESLTGAMAFASHVAAAGGLRPGLEVERAAEACWALSTWLLQHLLDTRGWEHEQIREWFVRLVSATLLDDAGRADPAPERVERVEDGYRATAGGRESGRLFVRGAQGVLVLTRTDAPPALADLLLARAVADARERGLRVLPACPFARWWLARHPEHADLAVDR